jgi:hypothetical protein
VLIDVLVIVLSKGLLVPSCKMATLGLQMPCKLLKSSPSILDDVHHK